MAAEPDRASPRRRRADSAHYLAEHQTKRHSKSQTIGASAELVVPLVHMLSEAEFDIKKEAAWAISNATSGGRHEQINTLVQAGAIKPLCDLLTCSDPRIITVALEGIENILKASRP